MVAQTIHHPLWSFYIHRSRWSSGSTPLDFNSAVVGSIPILSGTGIATLGFCAHARSSFVITGSRDTFQRSHCPSLV
jgi:hypothetical protein